MDVSTNRGNNLLLALLKFRYPNVYKAEQIAVIAKILAKPIERSVQGRPRTDGLKSIQEKFTSDTATDQLCISLLMSYVSENGKAFPLEIGADYTVAQRNQLAEFLVRRSRYDEELTDRTICLMSFTI